MDSKLVLYNTLTRRKEVFEPITPGRVGMYVCGPTVYGDPHLGHARPAVTFDLLFRYLKASGYKVRYVRNITDVGHLEHDADEGEDKIAKKARLEQLEPMEVAHYYTERYHHAMDALNVETPSIEPCASGHIIEQIAFVKRILDAGYAYVSNGSVYFDVEKYNAAYNYGRLSGRNLDDIVANTRELDGQSDKHHSYDFALWKKASPEHIMRWPSPWSDGFPGWHMECSAMSTRYLGERFDIHGGGMDLMFPHHECEIAQSTAALGHDSARYWVHNNMITINGQKMGKSLGNFITLEELFTGRHRLLAQAYSPMTIRFFVLQAHYRSTLDFSNEALQAAEKGLDRLMKSDEGRRDARPPQGVGLLDGQSGRARGALPRGDGRRPQFADGHLGPLRLGAHHQPDCRGAAAHLGRGPQGASHDGAPLRLRHPRTEGREGGRRRFGPRLRDAAGRAAARGASQGACRQGLGHVGPHPRRPLRRRHPRQGPQGRQRLGARVALRNPCPGIHPPGRRCALRRAGSPGRRLHPSGVLRHGTVRAGKRARGSSPEWKNKQRGACGHPHLEETTQGKKGEKKL